VSHSLSFSRPQGIWDPDPGNHRISRMAGRTPSARLSLRPPAFRGDSLHQRTPRLNFGSVGPGYQQGHYGHAVLRTGSSVTNLVSENYQLGVHPWGGLSLPKTISAGRVFSGHPDFHAQGPACGHPGVSRSRPMPEIHLWWKNSDRSGEGHHGKHSVPLCPGNPTPGVVG